MNAGTYGEEVLAPQAPQDALAPLLTAIFKGWTEAEVDFVILRNYSNLPHSVGNDLDVLVDPYKLEAAEAKLREAAAGQGFRLTNRAEFSPVSLFLEHLSTHDQLHIDLFTGLKWRGFDIVSARVVLAQRQGKGLFSVPHPLHEACINLLTRLLYHGYVREKYKSGIVATFTSSPAEAVQMLAESFGEAAARQFVGWVMSNDWAEIEANSGRWRRLLVTRQLCHSPLLPLSAIVADIQRLLKRWLVPPGMMVVMLGPDGSGKSTVTAEVMSALAPTFAKDKSLHLHWKPSLLRRDRDDGRLVTDPHSQPPRRRVASIGYFAFHLFEFAIGGQVRLRPVLFRNGLSMVDRYYYDLFVDPLRYRLDVPTRLIDFGSRFLLRPDLVFCLDASPEVLHSRKQEVALAETARQRQAYFDLAVELPNGHIVDSSRPLEQVVAEVRNIILDHLAERTAQRLELLCDE